MQGTIQTIRAERGFGFQRDTEGGARSFSVTVRCPPLSTLPPSKLGWWSSSRQSLVLRGPAPLRSGLYPRPTDHENPRQPLPGARVRQTASASSGPLQAIGAADIAVAAPADHPQEAV